MGKFGGRTGSRVRVRVMEGVQEVLWGMCGTITCRYGHPDRATYNVRLDGGRSRMFWYYQLEESG